MFDGRRVRFLLCAYDDVERHGVVSHTCDKPILYDRIGMAVFLRVLELSGHASMALSNF